MDRRTFKSNVVGIILDSIKAHCNVSRHINTVMTSKHNGFYFKFYKFDQEIRIQIFPEANICICIKDCFCNEISSPYYTFDVVDDHEKVLAVIQKDLDLIIQDFYNKLDCGAVVKSEIVFSVFRKGIDWMSIYSELRPE